MDRRTWLKQAAACAISPLASGCTLVTDIDHTSADAPAARGLASPPRVAWVFGSGGPRGFVHVGVLKALDELGLVPDLLVGASVGSLVAVLRGAGLTAAAIETLALELQPMSLARLALGARESLSGAPLAEWIAAQTGNRLLEAMSIPVACVALRMDDRAVVAFTAGVAGIAVQASAAIEGRYTPVRIHGRRYADPDLERPLPVREARALGAIRVLAVDASAHEERAPPGAERYREGDLRKRALTRPDAEQADVLLHPDFGYWVSLSREFRERSIAAGYQATMTQASRLRALHARPAAQSASIAPAPPAGPLA